IWNLVGLRTHHADGLRRKAELAHCHASDLRIEALPHLGSAMIHLNRAIAINKHERSGLIEPACGKRDAELHRSDCDASFDTCAARRVDRADLRGAREKF